MLRQEIKNTGLKVRKQFKVIKPSLRFQKNIQTSQVLQQKQPSLSFWEKS